MRQALGIAIALLVLVTGFLTWLAPKESEKPQAVLFMPPDCSTCRQYEAYLRNHGFRVQAIEVGDMAAIRARYRIPRTFEAPQVVIIEGLFFEGHVPARDVRQFLEPRNQGRARGLIVPGTPRGAPGLSSAFAEPYTVYLVRGGGLIQPVKTYNHGFH